RLEWLLEKATELGATRFNFVGTRRTDVRLAATVEGRLLRWRKIVQAAAEQSRRADAPELGATVVPLAAFLAQPPPGRRLLLSELAGGEALAPAGEETLLLAGPEGGFAAEEFSAIAAAGFTAVSLGSRILRCETAVLAALARLGA
ncbi:MAG: RsmE family RNA methyltransferase, partial [Terriglobales bacterium]